MGDEKSEKSAARGLGITGETVRRNIRWIRDARNISAAELSETLGRLERPIPVLGIQRIEAGTRRVDADDLVTIAVALGVSPASLLMPMYEDGVKREKSAVASRGAAITADALIPTTAWNRPIAARAVWRWLTARAPLVHGTMATFVAHGWPVWVQEHLEEQMLADLASTLEPGADIPKMLLTQRKEGRPADGDD